MYLDSAGDKITELANQGIDDIITTQSFDLSVDGTSLKIFSSQAAATPPAPAMP